MKFSLFMWSIAKLGFSNQSVYHKFTNSRAFRLKENNRPKRKIQQKSFFKNLNNIVEHAKKCEIILLYISRRLDFGNSFFYNYILHKRTDDSRCKRDVGVTILFVLGKRAPNTRACSKYRIFSVKHCLFTRLFFSSLEKCWVINGYLNPVRSNKNSSRLFVVVDGYALVDTHPI